MAQPVPLIDSFGRLHDNLRISVTDRCNIRCFYCMPETGVAFVPHQEILGYEELERFARIAVALGITKIRVTGGEPLVRRDLPVLIRRLAAIPGISDLALTTNGVLLDRFAEPLYAAGLRRLNVHLDTLDRVRFIEISRRDELDHVLAGLDAAKRAGFDDFDNGAVIQNERQRAEHRAERDARGRGDDFPPANRMRRLLDEKIRRREQQRVAEQKRPFGNRPVFRVVHAASFGKIRRGRKQRRLFLLD